MSNRHVVAYAADAQYLPTPDPRAGQGLGRWTIADENSPGAVHTEFNVCALQPGGFVSTAVQSYEECFFVLEGNPVVRTPDGATRLVPGAYGLLQIGVPHAWRNGGDAVAKWAQMRAPQPRAAYTHDVHDVPALAEAEPGSVDPRDPRTRSFGHIEPFNMFVENQRQEMLAQS